jgi:UDP-N-acetylmuramoyl-L-alanyl-D-glutamate--2,6-diaminopimelate ligase
MTVSLKWLMDGIAAIPESDAQIVDLAIDSRDVRAGSLFLALRGTQSHGLAHAADAAARGASAVLFEPAAGVEPPSFDGSPFAAPVPNLRRLAGRIADRFFQWPSSQMRIVGITGTNGKTTCAYLITQCLERLGRPAGYMGTIGWGLLGRLETPTHTTPDAVSVHRSLARLKSQGVREVAMEVSSHALDQGRVDGVRFHTAAFTNLSRDHLDYHASMEAYGEAKARLFRGQDLEHAVINVGDAFGRELAHKLVGVAPLTALWVGRRADAWLAERFLEAREVRLDLAGISLDILGSSGEIALSTQLLGRFNAENVLVVLGCLLALGVSTEEAAAALAACSAPPGRMEVIKTDAPGKPLAVIDYAHTPDALAKALAALREHCRGELWCVFGCGGDRDAGKRPIMGSIADDLADEIIVTDDNPRSEDPQEIIRAITRGIKSHPARVIPDRAAAIAAALNRAQAADIVLIAGKGHEDYQIYGATRRSFSDRAEAQRVLGVAA